METKTLSDDLNPEYIFIGIATDLLTQIVKKEINSFKIACKELSERGLDMDGKWIGFEKSKELFEMYL